jgi:predicted TIM-barrel fold metal-dependent hydrolase
MLLEAMDKFGIQRTALMASTTYTLTLNPMYGFEGWKENNESIIALKKKWPDRFAAFVTFDPCSGEDNLALVKDYVSRGADGVKLYLGHGASTAKFAFHCEPIDHPNMEPFFAWAEETQLPVLMHVNLEKYWDEVLHVLEKHPYLRITLPHFGLHKNTEQRLKRLGFLLDRYPFVYTDTSFGYYTFQIDGFEVLAKFRSRSREFFAKHANKIMYASDMVLEPTKDEPYIVNTLRSYLQFLEKERWRLFLVPSKTMHGMGLDEDVLKKIYEDAPKSFLLVGPDGMLPDRTKNPVVSVERPPIPPLTPDMIPPLKAPPSSGAPAKDDDKPDEKQGGCEFEHAVTDDENIVDPLE